MALTGWIGLKALGRSAWPACWAGWLGVKGLVEKVWLTGWGWMVWVVPAGLNGLE